MMQIIRFFRSPFEAKRKTVKPFWRTSRYIAAGLVLVAILAVGGGAWVWQQGWLQVKTKQAKWAVIAASAKAGLAVAEISVEGRVETDGITLLRSLRLARGAPILAFDPAAAQARVAALPWIKSATIERQLPDLVHVSLVERRPLALWQRDGNFSLIDTDGEVINIRDLGRFQNLIVVVGADAPKKAADLFDILGAEAGLAGRVRAAVRVGARRWNIHLDNNVKISLPEENAISAWRHLAELQARDQILEGNTVSIDLRMPDRIILRKPTETGKQLERDT